MAALGGGKIMWKRIQCYICGNIRHRGLLQSIKLFAKIVEWSPGYYSLTPSVDWRTT